MPYYAPGHLQEHQATKIVCFLVLAINLVVSKIKKMHFFKYWGTTRPPAPCPAPCNEKAKQQLKSQSVSVRSPLEESKACQPSS